MKKLKKTKIFIFGKKSHNAEKKLKGGTLWNFSTSILSQNIKKCRGDPLGKIFFRKKSLAVPKKMKRGSLWSRPVWYVTRKNRKKPFWFSSLDQIVHFDAIIFCRTFVELFWSVRVDRKKRVTIIVAFHFMKRRLKRLDDNHFKIGKTNCVTSSFVTSLFVRSFFVTSSFVTSSFVTSSFVTSSFVTSSFVTSSFVTSSFVTSSFVASLLDGTIVTRRPLSGIFFAFLVDFLVT